MSAESAKAWKKANPLRYAYQSLKDNAKRRGKAFELTFEQFKDFCIKSEYGTKRGRFANSFHIDRRDENGGYTIDNIQALTNGENVRKYIAFKYRDSDGPHFETVTVKPLDENNYPF
jgi:hypothetical protein